MVMAEALGVDFASLPEVSVGTETSSYLPTEVSAGAIAETPPNHYDEELTTTVFQATEAPVLPVAETISASIPRVENPLQVLWNKPVVKAIVGGGLAVFSSVACSLGEYITKHPTVIFQTIGIIGSLFIAKAMIGKIDGKLKFIGWTGIMASLSYLSILFPGVGLILGLGIPIAADWDHKKQ